MKLLLILAADYANITREGKLNVMGIFREIQALQFPVRHASMHLVVILGAELGEYGQTRILTIKLRDPDGKEILSLSGPINIPEIKAGIKPEINTILDIKDIIFQQPGPYQFVVSVDKDYKGDLTIYVKEIEALNIVEE